MSNWSERVNQYILEGRTVSGGKGDKVALDSEKAQASFTKTLQAAFTKQFANQQDVLNLLKTTLTPQLTNPTGIDAATKTAMNSQVINQSATDTQNAIKASQAISASHGGATSLPSGVDAQITGQIVASGNAEKDQGLTSVQQQDAQLKEQNYLAAINGINGVASQINPLGYASGANSGSDAVSGLSQAYTASNQSQLLGALGGVVGGAASGFGAYFGGKH